MRAVRETISGLKNWPDVSQWIAALKVAVPALAIIAAIGFLSGWLQWSPITDWAGLVKIALILFLIPALAEEFVFRGLLLSWLAARWARWAAWISTVLFVLWHPFQALTIGSPSAEIFLHPSFWLATLIFGIILSHIRIRSQSLWPVIFIHWFAVVIWKTLLGGSFY